MDTPEREPEPLKNTVPPRPVSGPVTWQWGREEDRRPQLPWIGVFLVVYGALLIIRQALPDAVGASNLFVLALGLVFLIMWMLRRGTFALYAGAFLTASAIPGLVEGAGYNAPTGLGTLCYGVALLFIGAVRFRRGGGIGWQTLLGGALAVLGASQLALPAAAELLLPVVLVVLGFVLLTRARE